MIFDQPNYEAFDQELWNAIHGSRLLAKISDVSSSDRCYDDGIIAIISCLILRDFFSQKRLVFFLTNQLNWNGK